MNYDGSLNGPMLARPRLEEELRAAINRVSAENGSGTPDFILANYLMGCLDAFDRAARDRDAWYGVGDALPDGKGKPASPPHTGETAPSGNGVHESRDPFTKGSLECAGLEFHCMGLDQSGRLVFIFGLAGDEPKTGQRS